MKMGKIAALGTCKELETSYGSTSHSLNEVFSQYAGIRSLSHAIIVFAISTFLGVKINWNPLAILNVIALVILAATLFATVSLTTLVSSRLASASWGLVRSSLAFGRSYERLIQY